MLITFGVVRSGHAQGAWVGDPKSLTVDLSYQYVPSSAVVITPDKPEQPAETTNHIYTLSAEYIPIENLALDVDIPLAMVDYSGCVPSTPPAMAKCTMNHTPPGKWDDGSYHTTLTDLRVAARYQIMDEPHIALTPYVAVSVPMENYEVVGFATGGRHLKQAHFGFNAGRHFDPVLPNMFFMAGYEFTLSEHYDANPYADGISQNRNDVEGALGYQFLGGDLSINLATNWRHQDHGIEFSNFGTTSTVLTQVHDPILKESYIFYGGGVQYAITHKLTVSGNVRFFYQGYNTRDQSLYGIDFSWRAL